MADVIQTRVYQDIKEILEISRGKSYAAINLLMVEAYWNIGKRIVEAQDGNELAEYGQYLIKDLSKKLTSDYGSGFDETNLRRMRKFYLTFEIRDTLCHELSWSHYRTLLKIEREDVRNFYIEECIKSRWSVRELNRQINSFYYERLLASRNKDMVKRNMQN